MGRKLLRILRHSVTMVGRNLRSYAMLSVTIVISFSLLLGYLGLMDSTHYNKYKTIFARDRHIVTTRAVNSDTPIPASMADLMQEKASAYSSTQSIQWLQGHLSLRTLDKILETGERITNDLHLYIYCLPRQSWYIPEHGGADQKPVIKWFDGKEHPNFDLKSGEIIMEESLYKALSLGEGNNTVNMQLYDLYDLGLATDTDREMEFTVVGTVNTGCIIDVEIVNPTDEEKKPYAIVSTNTDLVCYFALEDVNPILFPDTTWRRYVTFYTEEPELVKEMLEKMDSSLYVDAVYESQNRALEKIQTEKGTKALVAAILLLLLGINLYSSFDNALNNRKFEIGVKRALGASAFSIVRQFFYEGLLVMIVDILLSVAIVTDIAITYKVIREAIPLDQWGTMMHFVLYISPYSVAIFIICAVVLTVVFSFVFAYKSTQVQIVDYLKAE